LCLRDLWIKQSSEPSKGKILDKRLNINRTFSSQTKTWDWIYADNGPVIMRNVTLNYFTADLKFINHNKLLMISARYYS
jgi:hypothetical protein